MGRYHPATHDGFIKCDEKRCGARNAPEDTPEYDPDCWRCGESLGGKPQPGDEMVVDVVDEADDGNAVCKTEGGFVLFLDQELSSLTAKVRVVDVGSTSGQAELIDADATP